MDSELLQVQRVDQGPEAFVRSVGEVFAVFGAVTQDSGNVSYGVRVGDRRYFVKTAGDPADYEPYCPHKARVEALRNAVRLYRSCDHPGLPSLYNVIESPEGPLLVYEWVAGELLWAAAGDRENPESAYQRFRRLPVGRILRALDRVYEVHAELALVGWVAVDFYDGSMIYDFPTGELHLVDLDMYRMGAFINEMGRMFGSSRFMAPEEFERGARIDQRTTVFTMGRTAVVFLGDGVLRRDVFRAGSRLWEVVRQACAEARSERFGSVAAFYKAWLEARKNAGPGR